MAPLLEGNGKKCGKQPHCAFFGHCGKREIEKLLIMRNFRTKD